MLNSFIPMRKYSHIKRKVVKIVIVENRILLWDKNLFSV